MQKPAKFVDPGPLIGKRYLMSDMVGQNVMRFLNERIEDKPYALRWGFPTLDSTTIPMFPGQLCLVVACSGHGKSTMLDYFTRITAEKYMAPPPVPSDRQRIVLHVTGEENVERKFISIMADMDADMRAIASGNLSPDILADCALKVQGYPIAYIGLTGTKSGTYNLTDPSGGYGGITVDLIAQTIYQIDKGGEFVVGAVVVDYAQALYTGDPDIDNEEVRRVATVSDQLLGLANWCNAVVVAGAQANMEKVESRPYTNRIPLMRDVFYSSRLPMRADIVLSQTIPVKNEKDDGSLPPAFKRGGKPDIPVTPSLMLLRNNKWRNCASGLVIPLDMGGGKHPGARAFGRIKEIL